MDTLDFNPKKVTESLENFMGQVNYESSRMLTEEQPDKKSEKSLKEEDSQDGDLEMRIRLEAKKMMDDGPAMPLVRTGISMAADMKLGWRPKQNYSGAPIPLYYDFEEFKVEMDGEPLYYGPRINNSIEVHRTFANKIDHLGNQSYNFKFPPKPLNCSRKRLESPRDFTGMNPDLPDSPLKFDSNFEGGNLDMVFSPVEKEYNLYMRVDTNTKGNHQWFYFSVEYPQAYQGKTVKFNVMNFTKGDSLYGSGMRVIIGKKSENYKWKRGGFDISYKQSKHVRRRSKDPSKIKYFYQLQFSYKFDQNDNKVYFAYCYPYTFSNLQQFLREIKTSKDFYLESILGKSLSGVDIPMITITSRLNSDPLEYNLVKMDEFDEQDSKVSMPMYKRKKYVIITARVHPGESNSSLMMQGFIKYLMGSSLQVKELRKRMIFIIVPMINVDGVIIGNYRTSMSGNDLNRRYIEPDQRVHPEISLIKSVLHELVNGKKGDKKGPEIFDEDIMCFADMHGHSRKKNVFVYGPQFLLQDDKYYRCRMIPKLLSEETSKFRFHSCQFKYEACKRKTARIVFAMEYNIMNCYTLEASFHGHFDQNRNNYEFDLESFEEMGEHFVNSLYEYIIIIEEEQRNKQLKEIEKKKRKKNINNHQEKKAQNVKEMKASMNQTSTNIAKKRKTFQSGEKSIQPLSQMNVSTLKMINDSDSNDEVKKNVEKRKSGIRSIKGMFAQLQQDEEQREEMLKIEEEELGFKPDNDEVLQDFEPNFDNSDSGADDSDADDGELGGKEKKDLFSDILGAINAFSEQYGGNTSYNQMQNRYIPSKKKKEKAKKKKAPDPAPVPIPPEPIIEVVKKKAKPFVMPPKDRDRQNLNKTQGVISEHLIIPKALITPEMHSNVIVSSKKETKWERDQRISYRQRIAQQGLLNRIGIPRIPPRQTMNNPQYVKYTSTVQQPNLFENSQVVLSPLVVNKIYTNETPLLKQNPINANTVSHKKENRDNQQQEQSLNDYFKLKYGFYSPPEKKVLAKTDQRVSEEIENENYYPQNVNRSQNPSSLMERFRNQEQLDIMKAHMKKNCYVEFSTTQNSFTKLSENNQLLIEKNMSKIKLPDRKNGFRNPRTTNIQMKDMLKTLGNIGSSQEKINYKQMTMTDKKPKKKEQMIFDSYKKVPRYEVIESPVTNFSNLNRSQQKLYLNNNLVQNKPEPNLLPVLPVPGRSSTIETRKQKKVSIIQEREADGSVNTSPAKQIQEK